MNSSPLRQRWRTLVIFGLLVALIGTSLLAGSPPARAQGGKVVRYNTAQLTAPKNRAPNVRGSVVLENGNSKRQETNRILMARAVGGTGAARLLPAQLPDAGAAAAVAPSVVGGVPGTAFSFTSSVLSDNGSITGFSIRPPDSMGFIGPTQYLTHVNGYIRTNEKTFGFEDGVINTIDDWFWPTEIRTAPDAFLSDPRVHFDRFTNRWFMIIIDVPNPIGENRILLAVSDSGVIRPSTSWTFYYIPAGLVPGDAGCLADYPTFGLDKDAVYIGTSMFRVRSGPLCPGIVPGAAFRNTTVFVIRKADLVAGVPADLASTPGAVTAFPGLIDPATFDGIFTAQGVVNYDANSTEGYFIGVDANLFGRLVMHKISNPGSGSPTISPRIFIPIPLNSLPGAVPHLGQGTGFALDGLDGRLMNAIARNGQIITSTSVCVDNTGTPIASPLQCYNQAVMTGNQRNAQVWYTISNLGGTPTLNTASTIFDPTPGAIGTSFWMGSVAVNGQGHTAVGITVAGRQLRPSAESFWVLNGPTGPLDGLAYFHLGEADYVNTTDPGGIARWGDYSLTSIDPCDDMTAWTIQEFAAPRTASGPGSSYNWGTRVFRMPAPPPPSINSLAPGSVNNFSSNVTVRINGDTSTGDGYYDTPGTGMAGCRLRLSAKATNGVRILGISYVNAGRVEVRLDTRRAATIKSEVEIANPDGQRVTVTVPITVAPIAPSGTINTGTPVFRWRALPWVSDDVYKLIVLREGSGVPVIITDVPGWQCGQFVCNYTHSTALPPGNYAFYVSAFDDGAWSPFSAGMSFTVAGPAPEIAPTFVP